MKRILSVIILLAMLMGMQPAPVQAAQTTQTESAQAELENNQTEVTGTNSLGDLIADEVEQVQAETSGGYNVVNLTIDGNIATVEYATLEKACLVVAIYTEDGLRLLLQATAEIVPEQTVAQVTLEGQMPEYFIATAYLLDSYDHSPLCSSYETPLYTREMQELLASTVDDYDPERVLNLDDDNQTNFAVYQEDTVVLSYAEGVNTVTSADDENRTYVIENADEQITELKEGAILAYTYSENDLLLVKVANIQVEGTTATLVGSDMELEEVFSHMKLEATDGDDAAQVDENSSSNGVTYLGMESEKLATKGSAEKDTTVGLNQKLNFKINIAQEGVISIDGNLQYAVGVELSYYISASYQRISLQIANELTISADVKAEYKAPVQFDIIDIKIPLLGGAVIVGLEPGLEFTASITDTISIKLSCVNGFYISHDPLGWDCRDLSQNPKIEIATQIEGELSLAFTVKPHAGLLGGVLADIGLELSIGGRITGTLADSYSFTKNETHDCSVCIDGDISVFAKLSVEMVLIKFITFEADLVELSCKIGDFYCCTCHEPYLTRGECPHTSCRITVQVRDESGKLAEGALVQVDSFSEETNAKGVAVVWLTKEEHIVTVTYGQQKQIETVVVDQPQKLTVNLGKTDNSDLSFLARGVVNVDMVSGTGVILDAGMCGPTMSWVLYDNGLLQLRGIGYMTGGTAPWEALKTNIRYVKIANGITSLNNNAFSNCQNLISVKIPAQLATTAFFGCRNVESIHYTYAPGTEGKMYDYTYGETSTYYYGKRLEYFSRESLKTVIIDEGVTRIGAYCFQYCKALESVTLPSTLKEVGTRAFENCSVLPSIALPDGMEVIEAYAFNGCTALETVGHPSALRSLGHSSFAGCTSLKSFTLTDQITTIPASCFSSCSSLEQIVIPTSVTSLGGSAFAKCSSLRSVTIPAQLGTKPFPECRNVESIHYTYAPGTEGKMPDYDSSNYHATFYYQIRLEYYSGESLKTVIMDEGVTRIGAYCFQYCKALESVTLPSTLKEVGTRAFENCSVLPSIALPDGMEVIEAYAFNGCTALETVGHPSALRSLGHSSFAGCTSLKSFTLTDQITTIPASCFSSCSSLEQIVIPTSVTSLGGSAFAKCSSLRSVTIPAQLATTTAFFDCRNVESIHYTYAPGTEGKMPGYDSSSYNHPLHYSYRLESYSSQSLKTVIMDEGVTRIGDYCFKDCKALESVTLPSTLKEIGYRSFESCGLSSLYFTGNAPTISTAFSGATLSAYYPAGNATWTADKWQNYGGSITWTAYSTGGQSSSGSTSAVEEEDVPTLYANFDGEYDESVFETYVVQTASFTGLSAGKEYAILVLEDLTAEDLLSQENLLFITQNTADENGSLSASYILPEDGRTAIAVACGASDKDLKDAVITLPIQTADGELKAVSAEVTYKGTSLVEGQDYVLVGDTVYSQTGAYSCYVRGIRGYTGLVECNYTVLGESTVKSWNLSLGDCIGMNFRVKLDDSLVDQTVIELSTADTFLTYPAAQAVQDEQTGEYCVSISLAAAQMTETVTLRLLADGNAYETKTYSVREYVDYILSDANGFDEKTKLLVRDMLHYGAAAQTYFGYNTENLANAGISAGEEAQVPETAQTAMEISGNADGIVFYGASMLFQSKTALRFYFRTEEDIAKYIFRVGESVCQPVEKDGLFYVEVTNIVPQDMDSMLYVTVTDSTDTLTVQYSPMCYIARMYHGGSGQSLKSLLQALYCYYLSAEEYVA